MPAGDEEDRVGPFTGEAALQIRRRMFLDAIQDVDQETGELVATETARNDLILPDTGENNQFIRRKFLNALRLIFSWGIMNKKESMLQ